MNIESKKKLIKEKNDSEKTITFFLEKMKNEKNYSTLTVINYQQKLNYFKKYLDSISFKNKENILLEVSTSDLRSFIYNLHLKHFKISSIKNYISTCKSFYNFCFEKKLMNFNPAEELEYPKQEKRLPKLIYNEDLKVFFNELEKEGKFFYRNKALFHLLYSSGMRVSECASVEINNIDFTNKCILISGKGNKERIVPISETSLKYIKKYIDLEREIYNKDKQESKLFISNFGEKITERGIRHITTSICKKCATNLEITPHKFRHTLATSLLNNGMDLRYIQEILGHVNLSTTEVYTQISIEQIKNKYEKLTRR